MRLFQGKGTTFTALQRPGCGRREEQEEGRWVGRTEPRAGASAPWCDSIPPVVQPKGCQHTVGVCGVCEGQEALNASLE